MLRVRRKNASLPALIHPRVRPFLHAPPFRNKRVAKTARCAPKASVGARDIPANHAWVTADPVCSSRRALSFLL